VDRNSSLGNIKPDSADSHFTCVNPNRLNLYPPSNSSFDMHINQKKVDKKADFVPLTSILSSDLQRLSVIHSGL